MPSEAPSPKPMLEEAYTPGNFVEETFGAPGASKLVNPGPKGGEGWVTITLSRRCHSICIERKRHCKSASMVKVQIHGKSALS